MGIYVYLFGVVLTTLYFLFFWEIPEKTSRKKNYCECGKEVKGGLPYRCSDCEEMYEPNDKLTGIY